MMKRTTGRGDVVRMGWDVTRSAVEEGEAGIHLKITAILMMSYTLAEVAEEDGRG